MPNQDAWEMRRQAKPEGNTVSILIQEISLKLRYPARGKNKRGSLHHWRCVIGNRIQGMVE